MIDYLKIHFAVIICMIAICVVRMNNDKPSNVTFYYIITLILIIGFIIAATYTTVNFLLGRSV
jgi:bacteriorhodopsin